MLPKTNYVKNIFLLMFLIFMVYQLNLSCSIANSQEERDYYTKEEIDTLLSNKAVFESVSNVIFNDTNYENWTDLDLSSIIGQNSALVLLRIKNIGPVSNNVAIVYFRTKGDTEDFLIQEYSLNSVYLGGGRTGLVYLKTDENGIIQFREDISSHGYGLSDCIITLEGYIK